MIRELLVAAAVGAAAVMTAPLAAVALAPAAITDVLFILQYLF